LLLLLCLIILLFFSRFCSQGILYFFRSAYFFNFDMGVPDDIGRVQGIPAVKKVKKHCFKVRVRLGLVIGLGGSVLFLLFDCRKPYAKAAHNWNNITKLGRPTEWTKKWEHDTLSAVALTFLNGLSKFFRAPLKLRPSGAIQICLLLLLLFHRCKEKRMHNKIYAVFLVTL